MNNIQPNQWSNSENLLNHKKTPSEDNCKSSSEDKQLKVKSVTDKGQKA